jgi:RNA polymerase sigma-70 factor (ECF subfamily)
VKPLESLLKQERRRLVASLAHHLGLGHLALAEDAVQSAAQAALERWPIDGSPQQPAAWLWRVARHAAIDRLRRESRELALPEDDAPAALADERASPAASARFAGEIGDDELALLFAACHPALPPATQVTLALRTLGGLDLATIADGLLCTEAALAQRLARGRERLRGESLSLPAGPELAPRRDAVLAALAVMFTSGYAGQGADARELCWEAIRLARALAGHAATAHPDADALAALLLFTGARLTGRIDDSGDIVPLPGQARDRWDGGMLRLGFAHLQRGQSARHLSRWHCQAGIAACHAAAADYASTDWPRIVELYELLLRLDPSAAPRLGHAIALAEAGDAARSRRLLEALLPATPAALRPHGLAALAHACARLGDAVAAEVHLRAAIEAARPGADRRLLEKRLLA